MIVGDWCRFYDRTYKRWKIGKIDAVLDSGDVAVKTGEIYTKVSPNDVKKTAESLIKLLYVGDLVIADFNSQGELTFYLSDLATAILILALIENENAKILKVFPHENIHWQEITHD